LTESVDLNDFASFLPPQSFISLEFFFFFPRKLKKGVFAPSFSTAIPPLSALVFRRRCDEIRFLIFDSYLLPFLYYMDAAATPSVAASSPRRLWFFCFIAHSFS